MRAKTEWWREWWSWGRVKGRLRTLQGRLGFDRGAELRFLKLRLDLRTGHVYDEVLERFLTASEVYSLYYILYVYSEAERDVGELGVYVSPAQLCRIIHCPRFKSSIKVAELVFGREPELLYEAAEPFGYRRVDLGDAGVKICALPRVPVVICVWAGEEGLPPSVSVMFDRSVTYYLDCEAAVALAGVTLSRLIAYLAKIGKVRGAERNLYRYQCAG